MTRSILALAALTLAACTADLDTTAATEALTDDPVQACPVPDPDAIAGHESELYLCAEDALDALGRGCGPDGYLLGYGTRYSSRFYRETRPRMSARGQQWIDDVLVCLQQTLHDAIDAETSCEDIRTIAFDSHPACYVDAGFCTLPLGDVWQVVRTVEASDWLNLDAARQVVRTAAQCSRSHAFWMHLLFAPLF